MKKRFAYAFVALAFGLGVGLASGYLARGDQKPLDCKQIAIDGRTGQTTIRWEGTVMVITALVSVDCRQEVIAEAVHQEGIAF
jgi:hypothetical protein